MLRRPKMSSKKRTSSGLFYRNTRAGKQMLLCHSCFCLCLLVPLCLSAIRSHGSEPQFVVATGGIYDSVSIKPLQNIEVAWQDHKTRSDATGRYEIKVPLGIRELSFSAPGHFPVRKV